jgi:hypothetical protein
VGLVSEIRPSPGIALITVIIKKENIRFWYITVMVKQPHEYMAMSGHVVSNKLNNSLENFWVFPGTRRFFDAGLGRHRNRRF